MAVDHVETTENTARVVPFRPRAVGGPAHSGRAAIQRSPLGNLANPRRPGRAPFADLSRYERRGDEFEDYRHRMATNAAALLICVLLVGAGVWLADKIVEMRKNQDCVLSGRLGCTHVDVTPRRW